MIKDNIINRLRVLGESYDSAYDIFKKRFLKLTYNTGAIEVAQTVMLDEDNNFYGIDAINRLIVGKFIDERYLVFYIINKDNGVTRFIGYNSESHITITFIDSNVSTGLKLGEMPTINEDMSIASTYHQIIEAIEETKSSQLLEYIKEINEYQKYIGELPTIAYKLGVKDVPVIKELTK